MGLKIKNMRISQLPKELRKLALKRQIQEGRGDDKNCNLAKAFVWHKTPEGKEFWNRVYQRKDVTKHPMYPKKQIEEPIFTSLEDACKEYLDYVDKGLLRSTMYKDYVVVLDFREWLSLNYKFVKK